MNIIQILSMPTKVRSPRGRSVKNALAVEFVCVVPCVCAGSGGGKKKRLDAATTETPPHLWPSEARAFLSSKTQPSKVKSDVIPPSI